MSDFLGDNFTPKEMASTGIGQPHCVPAPHLQGDKGRLNQHKYAVSTPLEMLVHPEINSPRRYIYLFFGSKKVIMFHSLHQTIFFILRTNFLSLSLLLITAA